MQVRRKFVFMHQQVEGKPSKKPKKQSDPGAVAFLKNKRKLGWRISGRGAAEI